MASTQKKAVLRMHDGNWLAGYLPAPASSVGLSLRTLSSCWISLPVVR